MSNLAASQFIASRLVRPPQRAQREHHIRGFRVGYVEYRHVMNYSTDKVFLERLDEDEEKFVKLIEFDPGCSVWDIRNGQRVPLGSLRLRDELCTYQSHVGGIEISLSENENPEIFLDTEVLVSKHYVKLWGAA